MRYRFGPFELDVTNARVSGPGGDLALRPMTLRVLQQLLEHAPQLLTHEQLLDRVWGRQAVTPGVVSQSIRELRSALGDSAQAPSYIETRHKLGYCFIAPVERVGGVAAGESDDVTVPAVASDDVAAMPPSVTADRPRATARTRALAVIAAMAIACALLPWRGGDAPGDEDLALRAVDIVRDGHPRDPEAKVWFRDGLQALQRRDLVTAQARLGQAVRRNPGAAAALAALAEAHALSGDRTQALQMATAAHDAARGLPRDAQLRVDAFVATLQFDREGAIARLQALFQLDPGDADAGLRLAAAQIGAGRSADAQATLDRVAALQPALVDAHRRHMLEASLAAARGEPKARLAAADAALASADSDEARIDARLEQASAELALGRRDDAQVRLDAVDAALVAHPWPDAALRRDLLAAALARDRADLPTAQARYLAAADAARTLGNRPAAAAAEREVAFLQLHAGDHATALLRLQALDTEVAALEDPRLLAAVLDAQSVAQQRLGDLDAARTLAQRALDAYLQAQDRAGEAAVRSNLAMLHGRAGNDAEARAQGEAALALFRSAGNRRGVAMAQGNLAILHGRAGRLDAARSANEEALAEFRAIDARFDVARLQFNLGLQDRRHGRLAEAETRLREALAGFEATQAADFRLQAKASLADLLLARADVAGADMVLADAAVGEGIPPQRAAALASARARLALLRGDDETARAGFESARALRERARLPDWVRMSALDLAELSARGGRWSEVDQTLRALRRDMATAGDANGALQAGVLLAAVLHARGDGEGAARLIDALEPELVAHPDAMTALRLDLVRAAAQPDARDAALALVAQRARTAGFELLALRTELLQTDAAGNARAALERRGVVVLGMPPALPY